MLVGGPLSAKTRVLDVLACTLTLLNEREQMEEFKTMYKASIPELILIVCMYGFNGPHLHVWLQRYTSARMASMVYICTYGFNGIHLHVWLQWSTCACMMDGV